MDIFDSSVKILTLGRFCISAHGAPVTIEWPDEALKAFFCSLLSPQGRHDSWDHICHSTLAEPATQSSRHTLVKEFVTPLIALLVKNFGFNPLIIGHAGIYIDHQSVLIDAFEFHDAALDGLRLLSIGKPAAALEKLSKAKSLYGGIYLPAIKSPIITNTRNDLESLYLTAILDGMPLTRHYGWPRREIPIEYERYLKVA
jgi:hypothetical protein